jgi:Tfp pilus assembly protein PilF
LTRLETTRGEWQRALDYGARATAVQFDPATVGAMSVAYSALGDSAQARSFAQAMSVSARGEPNAIHRAWGLFLLDHGTAADHRKVLRLARAGLRERRDVYAYDLLAWALFRVGKIDEARTEMSRALAQNTEDVMLREHARAIGAVSNPHLSAATHDPSQ